MEYKLSNIDINSYKINGFVTPQVSLPSDLLEKM